ncbi:MAG: hypothetical protein LBM13_06230 [Candidatus Ancillula sp.]|jgi:hypothetical protein|nr:hypothetical protein [Candidatus Ancillula sp.]
MTLQDYILTLRAEADKIKEKTEKQRKKNDEEKQKNKDYYEQLRRDRINGKYGVQWQKLQNRIDMGQTSQRDIFSGEDKSIEAQKVREYRDKNFLSLRKKIEEEKNKEQ